MRTKAIRFINKIRYWCAVGKAKLYYLRHDEMKEMERALAIEHESFSRDVGRWALSPQYEEHLAEWRKFKNKHKDNPKPGV